MNTPDLAGGISGGSDSIRLVNLYLHRILLITQTIQTQELVVTGC